jgi:hypothetical protein
MQISKDKKKPFSIKENSNFISSAFCYIYIFASGNVVQIMKKKNKMTGTKKDIK